MRKLSAIFLTGIFAFSQYARQLSYLECKFSNTFKHGSAKCDCEKQVGFGKQDTNQLPLPKMHTHIHPDEFFAAAKEVAIDPCFKIVSSESNRLHRGDECDGNHPRPWQPPNP